VSPLDFVDAAKVFDGPLLLFKDPRENYGEQRMIVIGLLDYLVVLIVHVESDESIRIIETGHLEADLRRLIREELSH
jgi:uncharacterized DUF497 family protein